MGASMLICLGPLITIWLQLSNTNSLLECKSLWESSLTWGHMHFLHLTIMSQKGVFTAFIILFFQFLNSLTLSTMHLCYKHPFSKNKLA